ncbi:AraC family transcriptional regulator ligand-binding domain-containing protein [Litorivivens sp.]|uniref:AraC family transcriptional regulator n=1 Tax=Litorivivens sp. TaxID=2020868 RepID=UPI003564758D
MSKGKEHITQAGKFQRLLDYLEKIGLNAEELARSANLNRTEVDAMDRHAALSSYSYSRLYEAAAQEMQNLDMALPWGAGIGTDVFRFMCYSVITCHTLRDALYRAARFERMMQPQTGHRIELIEESDMAALHYLINSDAANRTYAPDEWDRTLYIDTVAKASGLRIWYVFMGWLIGRNIDLDRVTISAPNVSEAYADSLRNVFQVNVDFDQELTALYFTAEQLDHHMIHTPESLDEFLDNAVYTMIVQDSRPASTGAAIKSLLAKSPTGAPPTFEAMADYLHLSPSSLRRRLQKEGTSYQELKDRYRRDLAIRYLRDEKLKIHEIGEMLGFLEPSSFIRSFKGWTGMTPKQFRNQSEED